DNAPRRCAVRFTCLLPPMILLAACGQSEKKDQPEVTINAGDAQGGVHIRAGKDGSRIKIGGEGRGVDRKLPHFTKHESEGGWDSDGGKPYAGSKVAAVAVNASDAEGTDNAKVRLDFTSPAAPAKAADWMAAEFAKKGTQVTRTGDTLAGRDKDGADFTVRF